jgi:hypothetical protein
MTNLLNDLHVRRNARTGVEVKLDHATLHRTRLIAL